MKKLVLSILACALFTVSLSANIIEPKRILRDAGDYHEAFR